MATAAMSSPAGTSSVDGRRTGDIGFHHVQTLAQGLWVLLFEQPAGTAAGKPELVIEAHLQAETRSCVDGVFVVAEKLRTHERHAHLLGRQNAEAVVAAGDRLFHDRVVVPSSSGPFQNQSGRDFHCAGGSAKSCLRLSAAGALARLTPSSSAVAEGDGDAIGPMVL